MTPLHWKIGIFAATLVVYTGVLFAVSRRLKTFFWRIAICLTPLVIGGLIVGDTWHKYENGQGGFQLGVDLVGGTILVYQIDQSKLSEAAKNDPKLADELATRLKRRIDPNDLKNVTIRPVSGGQRVEIILPTGGEHQARIEERDWNNLLDAVRSHWQDFPGDGKERKQWQKLENADFNQIDRGQQQDLIAFIGKQTQIPADEIEKFVKERYKAGEGRNFTSEEIQKVKEEISQVGNLEFDILANSTDDKAAIDAAREYIDSGKHKEELEKRAREGLPPPPPVPPPNIAVTLPDGHTKGFPAKDTDGKLKGNFTYSWVELGMEERDELNLDNPAKGDPTRNSVWLQAARFRDKTMPFMGATGAILYSRNCENLKLPEGLRKDRAVEYFVLVRDPAQDPNGKPLRITGEHMKTPSIGQDRQLRPAVNFSFDSTGANLFRQITSQNLPSGEEGNRFYRHLAIILDGYIISAPRIITVISDQGQITGGFTKEKVAQLVNTLKAGALPATLERQPVSEDTMGATLGADTIYKGTRSVLLAFATILVFMIVYYRFAGLVASVALLANLLLTVAFMVLVNASFTLPGLAGLVLMLGMAVDANVLIYERLREERDRGASLALAIRNGYDRAFPVIIDTHLSSIFTAIVLYAVGNDQLKGFGISLTVGLIISLFTSLYMTRLLFDLWLSRGWLHRLSMFRLLSRPNINFMGIRYIMFTATGLSALIGIALFVMRLPQDLNIDFVGGTAYGGQLIERLTIEDFRSLLDDQHQEKRLQVPADGVKELPESSGGYAYNITWVADGNRITRTIHFPDQPVGNTPEQRAQNVRARASHLPDWSVEIRYPSFDTEASGTGSRFFTIRTSEKAPELVQAEIDRLLVDQGNSLLKKVLVVRPKGGLAEDVSKDGKTVTLHFMDPTDPQGGFASPNQVKMLLDREFRQRNLNMSFDVTGVGEKKDDRFKTLQIALSDAVKPEAQLVGVLDAMANEFDRRPQPDRLETFDKVLAGETQLRAMYAILASWGALLLYMWFRFGNWTFGLANVLCLVHDLFFTMGVIALCHYIQLWAPGVAHALLLEDFKIDLPAVAALLTLVGYSANDTIVVFDRIREVRGKNPDLTPQMINDSVNQTLSRTLLTSFATWLVVFVLYVFGGEGVHLFAFCMVIGVVVGTYSSIYIASPLLLIFGEGARRTPVRERQLQPAGAPV